MPKLLYFLILLLHFGQIGLAQIGNKTIKGNNNSIINGNYNIVNNTTIIQQTKTIYADKSFKRLTTLCNTDTAFSRKFRVFLQNPELLKDLVNKEVERKDQILDKSAFMDLLSGYIAKNKQLKDELESTRLEINDSLIKSKFLKAEEKLSNFDNEGYQLGMDELIQIEELKESSIKKQKALFYYFKAGNFFIQEKLDSAEVEIKKATLNDSNNIHFFLLQVRILNSQFKLKEALDLANHILSISSDSETIVGCYRNIAETYARLRNDVLALEYDQKALKINEEKFAPDDLLTAIINSDVGAHYIRLKKFNEALFHLNKARLTLVRNPNTNAKNLCHLYNNLGVLYKNSWEYEKSIKYYKLAIELAETEYGENNTVTSSLYSNLGIVLGELKIFDKSLLYLNKALKTQEELSGINHPITAETYGSIGRVYFLQKKYTLAIELFNREKAVNEKILGKDNILIGTFHNNMGLIYHSQGMIKKAISEYKIALTIYQKNSGESNILTAMLYGNLGMAYEEEKNYRQTIYCYRKALAIFEINEIIFPLKDEFEKKILILSKKKL